MRADRPSPQGIALPAFPTRKGRVPLLTLAAALLLSLPPAGCNGPPATPPSASGSSDLQAPAPDPEGLPGRAASGYTDVAIPAGIAVEHRLPGEELDNIVDAVGNGAAFADLDGDGWLDLLILSGPRSPSADPDGPQLNRVHLFRNSTDGTFLEITGASGLDPEATAVAAAVGDVDGDGDRDLYLVDRGPNRLYRNEGDATFVEITDEAGVGDSGFGVGAVFFDMDGDGDLDLYVTNYLDFDPDETSFYPPTGFPGPLAYEPQRDVLYRNRGNGLFEDVTLPAGIGEHLGRGMSLATTDFEHDGDTDVFVANDATENFLMVNQGDGRFVETGLMAGVAMGESGEQTSAMASDVGDVDGDGLLDLAVSDTAFGSLYLRRSPDLFVDAVMKSGIGPLCGQYVSWGQSLLDYDNDGDLDLFVVNGGLHHLVGWEDLLLRNDGAGSFEDASLEAGDYFARREVGRTSITGDYDNDGDIDVLVTTLAGRPYLLRNDSDGESAWITLDLVGRAGRDPFGAQVRVVVGDRTLVAEARPRTGYLGEGDPRLHFGLGRGVGTVDEILVTWPGGGQSRLTDVPARQILSIRAPAGDPGDGHR